jgi:hypothetical protein
VLETSRCGVAESCDREFSLIREDLHYAVTMWGSAGRLLETARGTYQQALAAWEELSSLHRSRHRKRRLAS